MRCAVGIRAVYLAPPGAFLIVVPGLSCFVKCARDFVGEIPEENISAFKLNDLRLPMTRTNMWCSGPKTCSPSVQFSRASSLKSAVLVNRF
jgi:hypothetical protein